MAGDEKKMDPKSVVTKMKKMSKAELDHFWANAGRNVPRGVIEEVRRLMKERRALSETKYIRRAPRRHH